MRSLALILAAALPLAAMAQTPAPEWTPPLADAPQAETPQAETPEAPEGQTPESGLGLIERGVGTFFENLLRDVQPQMEDVVRSLDGTFNRLAPVFDDLGAMIDDIGNYEAPERLPNGDILIRRLPDAPPPPPVGDALRGLTAPTPGSPATPSPPPDAAPLPPPPGPPIEL